MYKNMNNGFAEECGKKHLLFVCILKCINNLRMRSHCPWFGWCCYHLKTEENHSHMFLRMGLVGEVNVNHYDAAKGLTFRANITRAASHFNAHQ